MIRHAIALGVAVLAIAGAPVAAQLPANAAYVAANISPGNGILVYDAVGNVTTLIGVPGTGLAGALAMDATNDGLMIWSTNGVQRYDIATGALTSTTLTGTAIAWGCLDDDGGMLWVDGTTSGSLYRSVDTAGTATTILWTGATMPFTNAVCWDGTTGTYVVAEWGQPGLATFLTRNGTVIRTVGSLAFLSGLDWSPWTGDVIASAFGSLIRLPRAGGQTPLGSGALPLVTTNGVEVLEQNTLNREQFLAVDYGSDNTYLSLVDGAGNVSTLNGGRFAPVDCEVVRGRPLWTANRWLVGNTGRMHLTFGPARAGDSYQVAMSSAHRPGLPLGPRTLHLAIDPLFLLTARNLAPALFQNFSGTLDGNGRATPAPQVAIPQLTGLRGVRVFAGAVAYNAGGISAVSNCWGTTIQ